MKLKERNSLNLASQGIGALLRSERTRKGLSIEEVARKTRISARFIQALEEDNLAATPGLVFARSFLRQYATLLQLDSEELVSRLPKQDLTLIDLPEPETRDPFLPSNSTRSWDGRWDPRWNAAVVSIVWIVLAVGAAIGAYLYFNRTTVPTASILKQETPKRETPKQETPKQETTKQETTKQETPKQEALAAPPVPAAAPTQTSSDKPIRLRLTAIEDSWVNLTADGKTVFTGVLKASETRTQDADSYIKLTAGNAGGLRATMNGRDLPAIGASKQVRTVRITAAGLQADAAVPQTPASPKP